MKLTLEKLISGLIIASFTCALLELSALISLSQLLGGARVFGLFSILAPAFSSTSAGIIGIIIAFVRRLIWFEGSLVGWFLRASHLPTMCAAGYWSSNNLIFRLIIPIFCMFLFWVHPVGAHAWPYALYWIIPVGIFFVNPSPIFWTALGSTFTAHAVGSIIWLYTVPMTSAQWIALIPIVIVERMACALISVGAYWGWGMAMKKIQALIHNISKLYVTPLILVRNSHKGKCA